MSADAGNDSSARLRGLAPRERARLAAILARLASPYESERAAAGLLATAFVSKHGLAWSDLAALLRSLPDAPVAHGEPAVAPVQERRHGTGKAWRGFCRRCRVLLGQALDRLT